MGQDGIERGGSVSSVFKFNPFHLMNCSLAVWHFWQPPSLSNGSRNRVIFWMSALLGDKQRRGPGQAGARARGCRISMEKSNEGIEGMLEIKQQVPLSLDAQLVLSQRKRETERERQDLRREAGLIARAGQRRRGDQRPMQCS